MRIARFVVAVALCGCGGIKGVGSDGGSLDMACGGGELPDFGSVSCGPMTCVDGEICVIFTPGVPPPPDAGDGYSYSCAHVPAACTCGAARCGADPSPTGCFSQLCQGEPTCRFDGARLTCIGL